MPATVLRLALVLTLGFLLSLAWCGSPGAATWTVTDFGDSGSAGQLRTLINLAAPGDTISIPAGTITLTGPPNEDLNASGDLDIRKNLTIQGAGAGATIIDGGANDGVLDILAPFSVVISGVTIRNGVNSFQAGGGGIRNFGTLTLSNAIVSNNEAARTTAGDRNNGGGIRNLGTMSLTNVVITGNVARGKGGGIYNELGAVMTLTDVTVSGNTVEIDGGGIFNLGTATLTGVTVSGNNADTNAGGIFTGGVVVSAAIATLTNVTVSGNHVNGTGGGIFNSATATLTNVTVTANTANFSGGGIANFGSTTLQNAILGGNTAGIGGGANCSGTITSLGHNLDSGTTCGFGLGDLSSTDPMLGPLQDNGGFTLTHALLAGSPAIDAGTTAVADCPLGCPTTDQRGVTRPQGPAWDIGAYEATSDGATPPPAPVITSGPASPTNQTSAAFVFSDADLTATFLCALDDSAPGAFAPCTSPQSYGPGLAAGSHTFNVKARNLVGDSGITPFTWMIDLSAPTLAFTGVPPDPSSSGSASFSFFATEPSTFSCQLDAAAAESCDPDPLGDPSKGTKSYAGLPQGSHTFTLNATDLAGNAALPLIFTWTIVDVTPPILNITSHPLDPTNSNTAGFAFETSEPSTFTCQLAGPLSQGPAPCTSVTATTGTQSYTGLGEGSYTFTVRAMDTAGNLSSATFSWVVDQTAPTVAFGVPTPAPNGNGWNNTNVSIPFTASDALSGIATVTPPSPLVLSAEGSAVTGTVTATDNAGNSVVATSPAVKIDRTPPGVTITTPADGAVFVVGATVLASYSCSDPLSGIASCAGPVPNGSAIDTASVGSKTFTVAATDNAGNPAAQTVAYSVVTTPPPPSGAIAGSVAGKGAVNPAIHFYDLKFTNTGTETARNVMLSQFSFKTLAGRGNVSYNTARSPKLPIALGDLAAGESKTVRVFLVVPPPVAKFSITETGQFQDPTGTTVPFSTSQDVSESRVRK